MTLPSPENDNTSVDTTGRDEATLTARSTANGDGASEHAGHQSEGFDAARLDDAEWRERLSPAEYAVLRQGGTEPAFRGEYTDTETAGVYSCRACGAQLFTSAEKFHSGCGWPAFYAPSSQDNVRLLDDTSHGMVRTEVRCGTCDSHLGHVFRGEGFPTPTDERFCINSVCLTLEPAQP